MYFKNRPIAQALCRLLIIGIMSWSMVGCGDSSPSEPYCGDGVMDEGEECDGDDFGDVTCKSLGLGLGDLVCSDTCTIDDSDCSRGEICGDGIIGEYQECDGDNLGGETCQSLGYTMGTLFCGAYCMFDTSNCSGIGYECGDGIRQGQEECDGDDLGGYDCVMLGYSGGTLGCDDKCLFDTSECVD